MRFLFLCGFILSLSSPAYAQLASWTLDTDVSASESSNYDGFVLGNHSFETEGDRHFLRLSEGEGVLVLPEAAAQLLDDGVDFEIRFDFRYESPVDRQGFRPVLAMRSAPCQNWFARCPGTGMWAGEVNGTLALDLNFVDGKEGEIPTHPANSFFDNIKYGASGSLTDWNTIRYVVSPLTETWTLFVNGQAISGSVTEPGESYSYDMDAIMAHILSNPIVLGGESATEEPGYSRAMHIDNVAIYSPRFFDGTGLRAAFDELTAHVTGQAAQSDSRLTELYEMLESNLPTPIDAVRDEAMTFLTAYEAYRPTIFDSEQRIQRSSLPGDARAAYLIMDRIQASDFLNDRVADFGHVAFKEREAFPGAINLNEPRVASASVTLDGTYQLNPNIILTASEFVVRPSGYWAPAGELVTIEVPQSAVDSGVSLLVGAHYRIVTHDLETQNRMHDISTEFPVDRTTIIVANPFGGGIYLKVPDGTQLGDLNVTISGAVKSAYYSHREGARTDVADWVATATSTSVPWVDVESDRFMTTMPIEIARDVTNPDEIMDRWEQLFGQHSELAGRSEPNGRAEYYIQDRQLVTPAFGAGYPVTISRFGDDAAHDEQWGTWNPFRILQYPPHFIFMHEMGHNLLINEFLYPDGISFTSESSVHIWGSKIMHTVYGLDPDEAFRRSSYQRMTMDLAAMDRMLTYNFRNDLPMGHDPTIDPSINDEIRYQHRGHGPIVDFAWLFGWDKLGEVYGKFYDGTFPNVQESWTHVRTRDQLVEASSEVLGVDTSPFWYFWGWYASEDVRADLASRFPQSSAIRERIEYYQSLIPADAAGYEPWHQQFMALEDDVHTDRWTSYRDRYESLVRDEVLAQFDRIMSMPVSTEDAVLPIQSGLGTPFPNPFVSSVTIPVMISGAGNVELMVFDMLGRRVATLMDGPLSAGQHEINWNPVTATPGVYVLRMAYAGKNDTSIVTVLH